MVLLQVKYLCIYCADLAASVKEELNENVDKVDEFSEFTFVNIPLLSVKKEEHLQEDKSKSYPVEIVKEEMEESDEEDEIKDDFELISFSEESRDVKKESEDEEYKENFEEENNVIILSDSSEDIVKEEEDSVAEEVQFTITEHRRSEKRQKSFKINSAECAKRTKKREIPDNNSSSESEDHSSVISTDDSERDRMEMYPLIMEYFGEEEGENFRNRVKGKIEKKKRKNTERGYTQSRKHRPKKFKCKFCGKSYRYLNSLSHHTKMHQNDAWSNLLVCRECNKIVTDLKQHKCTSDEK